MKRDDKEEIHLAYVSSDVSINKLSKRYGVSPTTLRKWRVEGHWDVEKKAFLLKAAQEAQERFDNDVARGVADASQRMETILKATDMLLRKVNQLLLLEDALAPRDLKSLSSTLLDVMSMQTMGKDGDEDKTKEISISFVGDTDDWAG